MTVLLTSFKRYHEGPLEHPDVDLEHATAYSVAVYQPSWYPALPVLRTFDIRCDGDWTRPRDFLPDDHDPTEPNDALLAAYHDALLALYWSRRYDPELGKVLGYGQGLTYDVVLCCWCPYDTAAQRQLKDYGSFVCHTWPVETVLKAWGANVVRDADRQWMVPLEGV